MTPAAGSRPHVLLIDDVPEIHRIFQRLLADHAFLLPVASAGAGLSRIAAGCRYDAIVCDVQMPDLTGADFMRELCRLDGQQASRVVFISGGVCDPNTLAYLKALPNRLISKPFTIAELREALALPRLRAARAEGTI